MNENKKWIGVLNGLAVDSNITKKQIEEIKKLKCNLFYEDKQLSWSDFDNVEEPRSIF